MTIAEFEKWILGCENSYRYMLLDRMRSDCAYFLGNGAGGSSLWGGTVEEHIEYMETLHNLIEVKPEWLTMEEIHQFKQDMLEKAAD